MRLRGLVPVYPLKGGVPQRVVRDAVLAALRTERIVSVIPQELQKKYALAPLAAAYRSVHAPESKEEARGAAERMALEEYFTLLSAFKLIKGDRQEARTHKYAVTEREVADFERRFPFPFTAGQQAAVRAWLEQDGISFTAVWFHMPYLAQRLRPGEYLFRRSISRRPRCSRHKITLSFKRCFPSTASAILRAGARQRRSGR